MLYRSDAQHRCLPPHGRSRTPSENAESHPKYKRGPRGASCHTKILYARTRAPRHQKHSNSVESWWRASRKFAQQCDAEAGHSAASMLSKEFPTILSIQLILVDFLRE